MFTNGRVYYVFGALILIILCLLTALSFALAK